MRRKGKKGGNRPSRYLHGTSPREQRRLALLNDLVNDGSLRELRLRGGEKILEMGSGLGQFARALAREAGGKGKVIGIERSREQIAEALLLARRDGEEGKVEFRQGDALDPPLRPAEWGTFDLAHARFLLEHLSDPLQAVRILVEAVRPGGRVILEDDDHDVLRLWPDPPGFGALWRAYQRSFDRLGNDPYVGRRLVSLLHQAGASPRRNTWIFFGSCAGSPDFPGFVENITRILEGAREPILSPGLLDTGVFDAALASLEAWGRRADSAFWFAISWAEGIRPS
jgi:SAM-dependent methyltransferase